MTGKTPGPPAPGYVALVLHAHLPYIRHPEDASCLEERWLYEGITDCYLPLLDVLERLRDEAVPFRLTLSLSPTLITMLADPLLQQRCQAHLERTVELSDREVARTAGRGAVHAVAQMYQHRLRRHHGAYTGRYQRNLLAAFAGFQDAGYVELITSAATHGFLPLLATAPGAAGRGALQAQVAVGVETYRRVFGRSPRGFWLPECGYAPGADGVLRSHGIEYFFVESHGVLFARPKPPQGLYAPLFCPVGTAAFGRDPDSSKQVWSSKEGYPGDFAYREFYRDVGYDLDLDYIGPYIHPAGIRLCTGLKYYRITGPTDHKEVYDPGAARLTAQRHAHHFVWCRERQIEWLTGGRQLPPIIVAPYDAELFGHWWFEGPLWIEFLARQAATVPQSLRLITPGDYLDMHPGGQSSEPVLSSWGYQGYCDYWLNGKTHWMYRHLHHAADRMAQLSNRYGGSPAGDAAGGIPPGTHGLRQRALCQAGRELLLAQASDWAFIIRSGTVSGYARRRFTTHIGRFTRLYEGLQTGQISPEWLTDVEEADRIFPALDPAVFMA